jgi:restriction endonuclease fold toxin 3 of polymorphic toxin system
MSNPIVEALERAALRIGRILTKDAAEAVSKLYQDVGKGVEKAVANIVKADTEHAGRMVDLAERLGKGEAKKALTAEEQAAQNRLRQRMESALGHESGAADDALNSGLGRVLPANSKDPAADALAARIGGRPRVMFENQGREYDVISKDYIGQSKPANFQLGSQFRGQAKATFEAAIQTGRTPYFHFEGPPGPGVIEKINEYAARYGVRPVIDTTPLGVP